MRFFPAIFIILFLMFSCGIVKAGDEQTINQGLQANAGGVYTLQPQTYIISSQINIPDNTELRGSGGTVLKIVDECKWGQNVPMIPLNNQKNITIKGIVFEGNQEKQTYALSIPNPGHPQNNGKKAWGNQVNTFIFAQHTDGITVVNCSFNNNLGDGLRLSNCKNIEFAYNTGSMGGHDTFFALRSEGIRVHHNKIQPLVNSAIRLLDVSHARVYNNVITWDGPRDAGPSLQIQHDSGQMTDIEVCNNVLYNSWGPGLWLVGKTTGNEDLWMHHNLFMNSGQNHGIYWIGGIIASGYDHAKIEKNVFDGSYLGAVNFYAVNKDWATKAVSEINSNILTNSLPGKYDGSGGYGINNQISQQSVNSIQNCYWNNKAGDTSGCTASSTDLFIDPKTNPTPSGWTWNGQTWVCAEVNPSEMGNVSLNGTIYDDLKPLTEEELGKFEFNNFIDILKTEITQTGNIKQKTIVPVNPEWQHEGKYTDGYIYLAGYDGEIHIDNESYIPQSPDKCAIINTQTKNKAPIPSGQVSTVEKKILDDGKLECKLKVQTKYKEKVKKTKSISIKGKSISLSYTDYDEKSENATFTKSFNPPKVIPVINPPKAYVTYYNNSHAIVHVNDEPGIVRVDYSLNGSYASDHRLIGTVNVSNDGYRHTDFSHISDFKMSGEQFSRNPDGLYIKTPFDLHKLNITVSTPYNESMPVTDVEYTVVENSSNKILDIGLFSFFVFIFIYGRAIYKVVMMAVGKWI